MYITMMMTMIMMVLLLQLAVKLSHAGALAVSERELREVSWYWNWSEPQSTRVSHTISGRQ